MAGRDRHRCQLAPVPGDPMVIREYLLDDAWDRRGHSLGRDLVRPVGGDAVTSEVRAYLPGAGSVDVHECLSRRRHVSAGTGRERDLGDSA